MTDKITAFEAKKVIRAKFGTLSHFCRLTGRQLQTANIKLRLAKAESFTYVSDMLADANKLYTGKASVITGYHLTAALRSSLRAALDKRAGTLLAFCREYNEAQINKRKKAVLTPVFISRILGGRTAKITPRVRELAEYLKVDLPNKPNATKDE